MKGYMYILECADGSYYTGSTKNLELRLQQHQAGQGANHTKKRLPVKLVYFEEHAKIYKAFYREKQVQGWSRKKKEVLIESFVSAPLNKQQITEAVEQSPTEVVERSRNHLIDKKLHQLSECKNESHWSNYKKNQEE